MNKEDMARFRNYLASTALWIGPDRRYRPFILDYLEDGDRRVKSIKRLSVLLSHPRHCDIVDPHIKFQFGCKN